MGKNIEQLVDECMSVETERMQLHALFLFINPPSELLNVIDKGTLINIKNELKASIEELGGTDGAIRKYNAASKKYIDSFSSFAAFLDSEDHFDNIEDLKRLLNEKQFSWLTSHIKQLKDFL